MGTKNIDQMSKRLEQPKAPAQGIDIITEPTIVAGLQGDEMRRTIILKRDTMMQLDYIVETEGYKVKTFTQRIFREYLAEYLAQHPDMEVTQEYAERWKAKHNL